MLVSITYKLRTAMEGLLCQALARKVAPAPISPETVMGRSDDGLIDRSKPIAKSTNSQRIILQPRKSLQQDSGQNLKVHILVGPWKVYLVRASDMSKTIHSQSILSTNDRPKIYHRVMASPSALRRSHCPPHRLPKTLPAPPYPYYEPAPPGSSRPKSW